MYPAMSGPDSLAVIVERLESVRSVSSTCDIMLTDAAGESVRLDGVFLAEPPSRFRLRAWKFGRTVLDVAVADQAVWVKSPEERDDSAAAGEDPGLGRALDGAKLADVFGLVGSAFFRGAAEVSAMGTSRSLVVEGPLPGEDSRRLICTIDRPTLTPRRFEGTGDATGAHVLLAEYRVIDGRAWPTVIRAAGGYGEIRLQLRDLELNVDLPAGAFTPPRDAVRTR